ncbi:fasciclin-like arabinogalactan protein 11 [Curcuma longa]|uniref:fasciclin-like arabinogalactan protein 11 n=1 Tax=Curcuma longa TaxID=136217 RepID=UPI003D9E0F4A
MKHFPNSCTISFLLLVAFAYQTLAQTATAPAPAGPKNITAILEKAGQYTTFIRLLRSTQLGDQIDNQLNNSNTGLTVFSPTDNAFSNLPPGTLNSLSDQQKVSLLQFHVLSTAISMSQFQTVSNPVRTQAGDANDGGFPLNVTTTGNQVNISTGVVNTPISNTIFSDNQLAVYQVDQVLLPMKIFGSPAPAAAPAPAAELEKEKKKKPSNVPEGPSTSSPVTDSDATSSTLNLKWRGGIGIAAAVISLCWSF